MSSERAETVERPEFAGHCDCEGHIWQHMGGGLYWCPRCDEEAWDVVEDGDD